MTTIEAAVEPGIQPGTPEQLSEAELDDIVGGAVSGVGSPQAVRAIVEASDDPLLARRFGDCRLPCLACARLPPDRGPACAHASS